MNTFNPIKTMAMCLLKEPQKSFLKIEKCTFNQGVHPMCYVVLLLLGMMLGSPVFGQQKKERIGDSSSVISIGNESLKRHYDKYAVAMRWNDRIVARQALYDIIVTQSNRQGVDSVMYTLAYLYYENKNYPSAALICNDLLEMDSKNIDYLTLSAASLQHIGALDKALQKYETMYLLYDKADVLYKIIFLQYRMARYTEALNNIEILMLRSEIKTLQVDFQHNEKNQLEQYSMELATLNLKGLIYEKEENKEEAKKAYQQALNLDKNFRPAKENLTHLK